MDIDQTLLIGTAGLILVFVSFLIVHMKKFRRTLLVYNAIYFMGSALLTIYSIFKNDLIFIILNGVMMLSAILFLIKEFFGKGARK